MSEQKQVNAIDMAFIQEHIRKLEQGQVDLSGPVHRSVIDHLAELFSSQEFKQTVIGNCEGIYTYCPFEVCRCRKQVKQETRK